MKRARRDAELVPVPLQPDQAPDRDRVASRVHGAGLVGAAAGAGGGAVDLGALLILHPGHGGTNGLHEGGVDGPGHGHDLPTRGDEEGRRFMTLERSWSTIKGSHA